MYELYSSVVAIRVENKTYKDICTKVPIADIFHTRQRARRSAVLTVEEPEPVSGTADQQYSTSHSSSLPHRNSTATLDSKASMTTQKPKDAKEDIYDTLWADYDYDYDIKVAAKAAAARVRIDFEKFGARRGQAARGRPEEGGTNLPRDIYCDLVENLEDMCLETSLLEIWKYDRVGTYTAEEKRS